MTYPHPDSSPTKFINKAGNYKATLLSKKDKGDYWQVTFKVPAENALYSQRCYKNKYSEAEFDMLIDKRFTIKVELNTKGFATLTEISDLEDLPESPVNIQPDKGDVPF